MLKINSIVWRFQRQFKAASENFWKDSEIDFQQMFSLTGLKGMKKLNKDKIKKTVLIPHAKINERFQYRLLKNFFPQLQNEMFTAMKSLNITDIPLDYIPIKSKLSMDMFNEYEKDELYVCGVRDFVNKEIELNYDMFTHNQIFEAILPDDCTKVKYATSDHVIQLILTPEQKSFRHIIAQVLAEKSRPSQKRAIIIQHYNKDDPMDFSVEHLAGPPNFYTRLRANKMVFDLNVKDVRWDIHGPGFAGIICKPFSFDSNDVIFDAFSGIGKETLPLASKGCVVHANEENIETFKWLKHNFQINGYDATFTNFTSAQFIKHTLKNYLLELPANVELPISVVLFINGFKNVEEQLQSLVGLLNANYEKPSFKLRIVCSFLVDTSLKRFEERDSEKDDLKLKIEEVFNEKIVDVKSILFLHMPVLEKDCLCADFILPSHILYAKTTDASINAYHA